VQVPNKKFLQGVSFQPQFRDWGFFMDNMRKRDHRAQSHVDFMITSEALNDAID